MSDQIYCTFADLWEDQDILGFADPGQAMVKIRGASEFLERRIGAFIPVNETKNFDGKGTLKLFLHRPLLTIDSGGLTHDGDTLATTDYVLYPLDKHWPDGPYTWIKVDPDASGLSRWRKEADVISIAGKWGLYNKSEDTGALVKDNPLAADGSTLTVDNAGVISPGESLLVGSEQILVTCFSGTGTDTTKDTTAAIAVNDTKITVATGHGVNAGEVIRVENEQMYAIRAEGDNTILVKRPWNGTTRVAHDTAKSVFSYRTFTIERGVNGTTAAAHNQDTAISRYIPPYLARYVAVQMATLMIKKAKTGYAGKSVSMEAEAIFYHKEFPKDVYEELQRTYRC